MTNNIDQNNIALISIPQLLEKNFFVPSYQRGYRWEESQICDLLNDIKEFATKPHKESEFYCLQPLVVKKMTASEKETNNLPQGETWYEVIDGQQRLTTIYLILLQLESFIKENNGISKLYKIQYQRHPQEGKNYIPKACAEEGPQIDDHYVFEANKTVQNWIKDNVGISFPKSKLANALITYLPDNNNDKANNVRFIWYETKEPNPIDVFTRLNIGKISLTDAELIKALMLKSTNFKNTELELRQKEIAAEWDNIEYTLQDDEFWLFIHDPNYDKPTRIEFIFNLMREENKLSLSSEQQKLLGNDEHKTFRYFYEYFNAKGSVIDCWAKVKEYFQTLNEWFNNITFYHYVGFLIIYGSSVQKLLKMWQEAKSRSAFTAKLKNEINNKIPHDALENKDAIDKQKCKPLLLFHNIQTVINQNSAKQNNENYRLGVFYKFPFHLYKKEGWDVEHINSNTTNPEADDDTKNEWLVNVYIPAPKDVQGMIVNYFKLQDEDKKKEEFEKIKQQLPPQPEEWDDEEKNRLWNYALLDFHTNRSYGNAIFSAKRRIIISKDQGKNLEIPMLKKSDGKLYIEDVQDAPVTSPFVPPCTKHVFLKYYSPTQNDNNYWTKTDAEAYLKDIENCVEQLKKN